VTVDVQERLAIGSVFAGHRIDAEAGRGGMGVVYRAFHFQLERTVALKVIAPQYAEDEDFRKRFKREARIAAAIRHPNVVTIFNADEVEGHLYITMDFVDGSLSKMIKAEGMEPRLAADLVNQTAQGLDAAHAKGLVHRDVKPANVLIGTRDGAHTAYLTDFGLTKPMQSDSTVVKNAGPGSGTPAYIAPEQILRKPLDARTDVYALGCVLFHALSGRVPFPNGILPALHFAHINQEPPSVCALRPELPRQFDTVVKRAMAKEPSDRYPSAGDLGRAAVAAAEGRDSSKPERSVAVGGAAPRAVRRRPWVVAAGGSLVGALVVLAIVLLSDGGGSKGSSSPVPAPKTVASEAPVPASPQPARPRGTISSPSGHQRVSSVIDASGSVADVPRGQAVWLTIDTGERVFPVERIEAPASGKRSWSALASLRTLSITGPVSLKLLLVGADGQRRIAETAAHGSVPAIPDSKTLAVTSRLRPATCAREAISTGPATGGVAQIMSVKPGARVGRAVNPLLGHYRFGHGARPRVWVFVYSFVSDRLYPQTHRDASHYPGDLSAQLLAGRRFRSAAAFGGAPGERYELLALLASARGSRSLSRELRQEARRNDFRGLRAASLPRGLRETDCLPVRLRR
jgi:serine/threonine protein kinase